MGPYNVGGRMLSVAVNPLKPETLLAGSAGGGLWRSRTGGKGANAWESITTGFPLLAASCIVFHPQDTNLIFVGTGEVYNHQAAGTGTVVWRTRGIYGTGILMSSDGGDTWSTALDWAYGSLRGVNHIAIDPHDPNKVYAATTEGVYMSPNLGGDWYLVLNKKMVTDLVLHPGQPGLVLAAAGNLQHPDRGIYRSLDGGGAWVKVDPGMEFFGKIELAMAPSAPDTVFASVGYAVGSQSELLFSSDFGLSWVPIGDRAFTYGWFAHDVAVHPTQSSRVLCAGADVWAMDWSNNRLVQRSDWQTGFLHATAPGAPDGPANFVHQNIHQITFDPTNPQLVYFATDGGIYRSDDGGLSFANCNGGLRTSTFYPGVSSDPQDSTFFMGGLENNGTAIYQGQPAWRRAIGGEAGHTAIHPTQRNTVFAGSSWMQTFRSTNRGQSFVDLGVPVQSTATSNFVAPFVLAPSNPARMYVGGSELYRSNGSGWINASGFQFDQGRKIIAIAVSHQNPDRLYVSTSPLTQGSLGNVLVQPPARILRSDDGGSTWTVLSQSLPDRLTLDLAVHPRNDEIIYAVMGGFGSEHVYRSEDAGLTWTSLGGSLPDVPYRAIAIDPFDPTHLYIGGDLGAWLSRDEGQTWEYLCEELGDPFMVSDLSVSPANRKLRMATIGKGMMEMPLVYQGPATAVAKEAAFPSLHMSPNPSRGETWVHGSSASPETLTIEVLDLTGRGVLSREQPTGAGEWRFLLAGESLVPGVYLVRITGSQGSRSLRWVLGD